MGPDEKADLRALFLELTEEAGPDCRFGLEAILENARRAARQGRPLETWLSRSALTKARLKERAWGAPSNKIAHAQIHRTMSREVMTSLSVLWLVEGLVPVAPASGVVLIADPQADRERPPAGLGATTAGTIDELKSAIRDIAQRLEAIGDRRATIAPTIQRSNHVVGILSPWFLLRRHGADRTRVHLGMDRFLKAAAPDLSDALFWAAPAAAHVDEHTSIRECRPVRKTCCLKYACASKDFCGTCPLRPENLS